MGDAIEIDIATFESRLGALQAAWKDKKNDAFNGVKSLLSVMGKTEEGPYSKSLALHVCTLSLSPQASYFPSELVSRGNNRRC